MFHVKPRLFTILTLTIYVKQRPNNAFTDIFLDVHNIQVVPYKQFFPIRKLKKYTLLPPVVPPNVFFSLLPFLDVVPKFGCSKLLYCCRAWGLVSATGAFLISVMLLKLLLHLRHLWF
jgi:hypothetical protein